MGKGDRPAACAVTGKRLRAKSWYYRDGKYFYNKRVWRQERAKLASDAAQVKAGAEKAGVAPAEPGAASTTAPPDAAPSS